MARKFVMLAGALLLIFGGLAWWRATHPPLTNEQQILANIEGLRSSAERGSVDGVMGYLADDFQWGGQSRGEFRSLLFAAFYDGLRKRDLRVTFTNVQVSVQGETAVSSGHFKVDQPDRMTLVQSQDGDFTAQWKQVDGEWKVGSVSGGENITQ